MISFYFCSVCEVQNADNAMTFKMSSDDRLHKVYAVLAGYGITNSITSNYCSPSCSAVYSNKTTALHTN